MVPCVRFKDGVRLDPLTPALARLLCAVEMTARMQSVDLTVSCGREAHAPDDPHTRGAAIDVRAADLLPAVLLAVYNYLRSVLGDLFYVQYEVAAMPVNGALRNIAIVNPAATAPHFHLQVCKGTIYPPQDTPRNAPVEALKA